MRAADADRHRRPGVSVPAAALAAALLAAAAVLLAGPAAAQSADPSVALKRRGSPVDPQLAAWATATPGRARALGAAAAPSGWPVILRGDGIVIDAASNGDPRALLAELEAIGLTGGRVAGNAVSGVLPREAIDALESCESLAMVRPAAAVVWGGRDFGRRPPAPPDRGAVTSQGVAAMNVDRLPKAIDGRGASVGLLSDTFDCLGGQAQDVERADLPPDVVRLDDPPFLGCRDEGRAIGQIVHDVAPRSRLGFHTAFNGQADFAEGIGELARVFGADVIVDDVIYFAEPFFQDGPIARAVDAVRAQGVTYVAAAGNAGRASYETPFRDSGQTGFFQSVGETRRHDFDPGPGVDVFQTLTIAPLGSVILVLQWDEPFVSASTADPPVGAASDYDLLVYFDESPTPLDFSDVVARSTAFNVGGDAFEGVRIVNPFETPRDVYVAIERFEPPGADGPDVERMKLIVFGSPVTMEWDTASGTSFGHANSAGAVAVGAAAWYATPRFGVSPPLLEAFSSAGGIPIVLDPAGERLPEPVLRETPDLVAPDGVNNTFFPTPDADIPQDGDAFPNFFGTSAAAPHVAGVAALLQGAVNGGAAVLDRDGALRALRMCFEWRWGRHLVPLTFPAPLEHVDDALAAGATLGPCWALSPDETEHLLEVTAVDMGEPGTDLDTGHGLVDAERAAHRLRRERRGALPFGRLHRP